MPDGVRAPLIIKDTGSLYAGKYRDELVVTVRDWYHNQAPFLIPYYPSRARNPSGGCSIPYSSPITEAQDFKLAVKPDTTN